jgi:hypothetical protein
MIETLEISEINSKKKPLFIWLLLTGVTSAFLFGVGVYCWQRLEVNNLKSELKSLQTQSTGVKTDIELRSPVDNKKLGNTDRLTSGFHLGGIPVNVYFEGYANSTEGRIIVSHAWNSDTNRNEGAFFVRNENEIGCLRNLLPVTKDGAMRFVSNYICGDSQKITVTSYSFDPTENIKDIKINNLEEINLNDYFSSIYLKSSINIIGWQDFDHLLINQITYSELKNSEENVKQELYLFNVEMREKQLIYTIK